MARFGDDDIARLMADAGIVRNRAKIDATIANARATLALHEAGASASRDAAASRQARRRMPR